jgi:hypothetical protein
MSNKKVDISHGAVCRAVSWGISLRMPTFIVASGLLLSACGRSADQDPRGGLGHPEVVAGEPPGSEAKAPAYQFRFLGPQERTAQPGKEISFRFELQVPQGAAPPTFLLLQVLRGKVIQGSYQVGQGEDTGQGRYTFEVNVKAPQVPGKYKVRIEAVRTVIYTPAEGEAQDRSTYIHSPSIDLVVTKG